VILAVGEAEQSGRKQEDVAAVASE
jgi:hypothetical protein